MIVLIGHAVRGESGHAISGGRPGDQDGREVRIEKWYNKPWLNLLRAKRSGRRNDIAEAMKAICAIDCGYDQGDRYSLFNKACLKGWDILNITDPCNTDCSAAVSVCINASGVSCPKDIYTGNMVSYIHGTGCFYNYGGDKYVKSADNLKIGDILVGKGHTCVVVAVFPEHTFYKELRKGDRGDDVKALQLALNVKADGIFGKDTKAALQTFQRGLGITGDGIFGKRTCESMGFTWRG